MVKIAQEPTTFHPDLILGVPFHGFSESRLYEQPGKVDSGIDCELQGTPESSVDLHEEEFTGRLVHLELHHSRPPPVEQVEKSRGLIERGRFERNTLTHDAHPAGWRLLSKPAVSSVIVGASSVDQLSENLKAVELALGEADVVALDAATEPPAVYPLSFYQVFPDD